MESRFRDLPSVDRLLSEAEIVRLEGLYPHELLVGLIRGYLQEARGKIAAGSVSPPIAEMVGDITGRVNALVNPSLRPVINATGVILHTNLGRAPLSQSAMAAMTAAARGYTNLEIDLATGERGSRQSHVESLIGYLTGAPAALVVNNNAAAVLLALTALAKRKEVIVARGQAVEIGGGFRIPDVMRQSGARLVEVGTTNCVYLKDYEAAFTPQTAALLRVHTSNFRVVGFTQSVDLKEMVTLGRAHAIPVFDDAGSGALLDPAEFGLAGEPTFQESVRAGASLVMASGDKLLGGPQAGIIVGDRALIDKLKRHPLARAVRIDKIRLAGLAATLVHYLKGEALAQIPIWRMISAPLAEIGRRAETWADALGGLGRVVDGESMVGGGSLPGGTLPTRLVAVGEATKKKGTGIAQALNYELRRRELPILGRMSQEQLLLDPRSVLPEEDEAVIVALREAAVRLNSNKGA